MANGSLDSGFEMPETPVPSSLPVYHSEAEVIAALEALSDDDIRYLIGFARWRILGLRGKADEADENDLFSLAVLQTFKLKRRWKCGVTLRNHLISCMRSIANGRFKRARRNTELLPEHPAPPFRPERALDATANVNRLWYELTGDAIAQQVLTTMYDGLSASEAQKLFRMPAKVYLAARKRIRRRAARLFGLWKEKADD
jgi:hypothetical protein